MLKNKGLFTYKKNMDNIENIGSTPELKIFDNIINDDLCQLYKSTNKNIKYKYKRNRQRRIPLNPQIFKVRDVNWSVQKQKRAGVIVYNIDPNNNDLEICLGKDTAHGSLTDFGGGVKNGDPTVIHAALREFEEETYGAFNFKSEDPMSDPKILESIVAFTEDIIILFLKLDYNKDLINVKYHNLLLNARKKETNGLLFLNKDGFCEGLNGGNPWIFFPIRDFLNICADDLFCYLHGSYESDESIIDYETLLI